MRFDTHQHYWHYDPVQFAWIGTDMTLLRRDFPAVEAIALIDVDGIDAAIEVQARRCCEAETKWLLHLAQSQARIVGVVGWINLAAADAAAHIAHWCAHPALRGLRHIVQDEPDPTATLADPAFNRGVRAAHDAGLVYEVLVHAKDMAAAHDFCRRHDRHHLVLDHLGKPAIDDDVWQPWADQLAELAQLEYVSAKLSGLVTEAGAGRCDQPRIAPPYPAHSLECFGAGRLMGGSYWPVYLLAADYATVYAQAVAVAESSGIEPVDHERLFGDTAARVYGLRDDDAARH